MIDDFLKPVSGYKTYIVVVLFLLSVMAEKVLGFDVPGFDPGPDWLSYVLGALGLGTLRAGVAKAAK